MNEISPISDDFNETTKTDDANSKLDDGEGIEIGKGNPDNIRYIKQILNSKEQKVLEVWQGHLDNYHGFRSAIKSISKIIKQ